MPPAGGQGGPPPRGRRRVRRAAAATAGAAAKPYKAVAISAPAAVTDPSFEAFRKQLGAAAEKKDRKALAGLVAQNFFWMGEKGDKADKKKPALDNLAKAIQLDGKDAPGWEMLGAASGDPTGTPFPDRKDTICAPADPTFNAQELEALAKATGTEEGDWAYPTQAGLEVHSGPQPNSPVVEKLGLHFVRVMQDQNAQPGPMLQGGHAVRQDRLRAGRGADPARQRSALLQQGGRRLENLRLRRRRPVIAHQGLKYCGARRNRRAPLAV